MYRISGKLILLFRKTFRKSNGFSKIEKMQFRLLKSPAESENENDFIREDGEQTTPRERM